jgi:glycosyltransferase involved in cell wall biosynthesis
MISIIIPAHNEARVIGRTLEALLSGSSPGEIEVVVVANGCTDETADIARQFGTPVRVIQTQTADKIHALNLGDAHATHYPRIYSDADVLLPLATIRELHACLKNTAALAAGIVPRFCLTGCSWAVRAFYEVNARLPSSREGIGGSGVYALSQAGRARFQQFPNVTADDGFVRILFEPSERVSLDTVACTVFPPRRLKDLIAIKARSQFGNYQLALRYPTLWKNRGKTNNKALLRALANPFLWPKCAVYLFVKIEARRLAQRRLATVGEKHVPWARDESSRGGDASPPVARNAYR